MYLCSLLVPPFVGRYPPLHIHVDVTFFQSKILKDLIQNYQMFNISFNL